MDIIRKRRGKCLAIKIDDDIRNQIKSFKDRLLEMYIYDELPELDRIAINIILNDLDEYDRNDSIYITRNRNGITAENLSSILKRNDIKKSDAYQSGFLEGTTPMYEAYMRLKKSLAAVLR